MPRQLTQRTILLTTLLVVGGYFLARAGERPASAPTAPVLLAMQENQAPSQEMSARLPVSNVGWIGIMFQENSGHGVKVGAVFPGGPAAFAGVRVGDVLLRVGAADVNSMQTAEAAIERLTPQKPASLSIQRGRNQIEIKVMPQTLAEFQQDYITEMMRRDPRNPKYGKHHGISSADMSAELVRRLFDQNERLDRSLLELTKEVHALRKQVAALQK